MHLITYTGLKMYLLCIYCEWLSSSLPEPGTESDSHAASSFINNRQAWTGQKKTDLQWFTFTGRSCSSSSSSSSAHGFRRASVRRAERLMNKRASSSGSAERLDPLFIGRRNRKVFFITWQKNTSEVFLMRPFCGSSSHLKQNITNSIDLHTPPFIHDHKPLCKRENWRIIPYVEGKMR